jgi:hypothetical protein
VSRFTRLALTIHASASTHGEKATVTGGPRGYSAGTERALFRLARGSCYFPEYETPILRLIEGHPVTNVEVAHICGAHPGSVRYDPSMTDQERASFDNLILLCTAHHKLVDRLSPDNYPVDALRSWKEAAEIGISLDPLREMEWLSDGNRFAELIERVVAEHGPRREISVELLGGLVHPGCHMTTSPYPDIVEVLRVNENLRSCPRVAVIQVRNVGFADVTVESADLTYLLTIDGHDESVPLALLGRNDFPQLNPELPHRLLAGASITWLTKQETLTWISSRAENAVIVSLSATVGLGSGEKIESDSVAWTDLPMGDLGPPPT